MTHTSQVGCTHQLCLTWPCTVPGAQRHGDADPIFYIQCTNYNDALICDRNVHCRTFTDGFEAAVICFENAGLW